MNLGLDLNSCEKTSAHVDQFGFHQLNLGDLIHSYVQKTAALKQANFLRVRIWGTPKTFHLGENMVNSTGFGDASHFLTDQFFERPMLDFRQLRSNDGLEAGEEGSISRSNQMRPVASENPKRMMMKRLMS